MSLLTFFEILLCKLIFNEGKVLKPMLIRHTLKEENEPTNQLIDITKTMGWTIKEKIHTNTLIYLTVG